MKKQFFFCLSIAFFMVTSCQNKHNPASYVDPFIGTGGHGHTYPGATIPFGMVQLGPDTRLEGWDGCSGYHYSDSIIYGFSHTHLSGTGIADYCDILLMPTTGNYYLQNGYQASIDSGYGSRFNKNTEKASPGYYAVKLDDYNISVELTSTNRVGFHKYAYPKNETAYVTLDLTHRDEVLESSFRQVDKYEIEGMRRSRSWAQDQYIYFVARFNQPIQKLFLALNDTIIENTTEIESKSIKAAFNFGKISGKELLVKVGISAVSTEGARKNLDKEIPGWNFDEIKANAEDAWNKELSKINIKTNKKNKTIFYTALYHTMIVPNTFMDVDGKYRGTDLKIHKAKNFTNYTIFSLWDTYRATHPLYTIIDRQRTNDFINTFINQYKNGGQLPVWELAANYTGCMIGYHSIPVIADAYMKGIQGYDTEKAFEAMKHSAMQGHLGLASYKKFGYVAAGQEPESVSKTLEYAYDDWCISQMAHKMGKTDDYTYYLKRAQSYKNIYDPVSGFMRAKLHGIWKTPFDPREVDFNYTEANAWQYSFYVPQDITGLIQLMDGKDNFTNKLDKLFTTTTETTGRTQADITGLIGQYAHGNEPSHHMAYMYNYANKPWKTQQMVQQIVKEMYTCKPDGYSGNEDCGQMSAWYIFSAMGFYPVTPASNIYIIGSPALREATIHLENGKSFHIKTKKLSEKNIYIQSATLNGKPYAKSYLTQQDIMNGGELVFNMTNKPNKNWGSQNGDIPVSEITDNLIVPVPYSDVKRRSFDKKTTVGLFHISKGANIYFSANNNLTGNWKLYTEPIEITQTTTLQFYAEIDGKKSETTELSLVKFPEGRTITLKDKPHRQYTANSDSALIDGITGNSDFRTGAWQGFYGVDLDAVIDLGKTTRISYLSVNFLQDINSWIFMPKAVEFYISNNSSDFKKIGFVENTTPENEWGIIIRDFTLNIKPVQTRYIKVLGKSNILCPDWHKGKGNKSFIFADEITIK